MKELEYPFDSKLIMKKKKSFKRRLMEQTEGSRLTEKKIAVLGGSTTSDIVAVLELFLLSFGIKAEFYESEYGQFWQDGVFSNPELDSFAPDIVYVHTSLRNLSFKPSPKMTKSEIEAGFESECERFSQLWDKLHERFHCPVIQNNFELPYFRLMGNSDASDYRGTVNFVTRLNLWIYEQTQSRTNLYLNDINWLSASYGLEKWSAPEYWYMYKYALDINAIPELCYQTATIIKALLGKNKKALALDLDNTLWGGIVGDDGAENLSIGQETAEGMAFYQWQEYVKSLKDIGVLLTVCSKNEEENALAGLNHPEGALRPEDFTIIKANWEPKSRNILDTAAELNILPDAIVLADDNPAEREIIRQAAEGAAAPEIGEVTDYIKVIDRSAFFEVVSLSEDDLKRSEMYRANAQRKKAQASFESYTDYLLSLEMQGEIKPFSPMYIQRLAQLANKSNQFNLTTRRYTPEEMDKISNSAEYITLYGKLTDKFGDNGVVAEVIGNIREDGLHIDLWLMSCRVLKRDMEYAMLDELTRLCSEKGIDTVYGYYYPTAKNKMVAELYGEFGFEKISEDESGTKWRLDVPKYISGGSRNKVIKVNYRTEE